MASLSGIIKTRTAYARDDERIVIACDNGAFSYFSIRRAYFPAPDDLTAHCDAVREFARRHKFSEKFAVITRKKGSGFIFIPMEYVRAITVGAENTAAPPLLCVVDAKPADDKPIKPAKIKWDERGNVLP